MKRYIFLIIGVFLISFGYAQNFPTSINLNVQVSDNGGQTLYANAPFLFNFTISPFSDCSSPIYSNSVTLITDARSIINFTLPNVNIDFSQYPTLYFCEYRDNVLQYSNTISAVPYAYISNNSYNLNGYNLTNLPISNLTNVSIFNLNNSITSINKTINNNNASWISTFNQTYQDYITFNQTNNSLYWQGHTGTDGSWLTGISGSDRGWQPNNASETNNYTTTGNLTASYYNGDISRAKNVNVSNASGTLAVLHGGTGVTSFTGSGGNLIVSLGTTPSTLGSLTAGTTGQLLTGTSSITAPTWTTVTYPVTTSVIDQILYATGSNIIGSNSQFRFNTTKGLLIQNNITSNSSITAVNLCYSNGVNCTTPTSTAWNITGDQTSLTGLKNGSYVINTTNTSQFSQGIKLGADASNNYITDLTGTGFKIYGLNGKSYILANAFGMPVSGDVLSGLSGAYYNDQALMIIGDGNQAGGAGLNIVGNAGQVSPQIWIFGDPTQGTNVFDYDNINTGDHMASLTPDGAWTTSGVNIFKGDTRVNQRDSEIVGCSGYDSTTATCTLSDSGLSQDGMGGLESASYNWGINDDGSFKFLQNVSSGVYNFVGNFSGLYVKAPLYVSGKITTSNATGLTGYVVCYLATGTLGHCTSIVGTGGTCTCVSN